MNNKKFNKILAAFLAGTMVLGMSLTAFAAEDGDAETSVAGSTTGEGAFEGHVEKSVLLVQLPTVSEGDKTFAYTMDPEGLIAATEGAKDKTATFEAGATVYFLSAEKTYTSESAKLKVVNKGSVDADVTVTAETASNTNIAMAGSAVFGEDNKNAELYLGLKVAAENAVAVKAHADGTDPVSVTVGLKGTPGNFEVKYDEANKTYSYAAKDGVAETAWNSFEFCLTGACNPNGDYSDENLTAADVTVTWSYAERAEDSDATLLEENATTDKDASIGATGTYNKTTGVITATVDLGAGTGATTLASAKYGSTEAKATNDVVNATISGTAFTGSVSDAVKTGWANLSGPVYVVITLANGTSQTVTLTMTE